MKYCEETNFGYRYFDAPFGMFSTCGTKAQYHVSENPSYWKMHQSEKGTEGKYRQR